MYRHFAVVTLVLTLGLAMFADGENRQAREVPVPASRPHSAPPAKFAAPTVHELDSQARAFARDMSGDFDNGFGKPMQRMASRFGSSVVPDLTGVSVPGYSQEYLASLSEEEQQLLLQGLQDNGMLSPEIRREQNAAIIAASSRRSGEAAQAD
jgi:hypothetical protein